MAREQIKEALDKIIDHTNCDPMRLSLSSDTPNDIRITYTNDYDCELEFKYTNGELYLLTDNNHCSCLEY